ncbi:MAG TPA: oligosaccharide flippase family protein [Planctomycetota bacterium]|nr:oligosaccharide flippase family protein [Planctomycetota bacterium]HRR78841.1 oligosaccharide flippase family protein [Planctomycetota bacterium]HRT92853.1 oligosaccharide flippase family protein [Planctomycetota bacterium]
MADNLRQAAISGAKWRVFTIYTTQAVQVVGAFALAWLLDKNDYGLLDAAMVVISLIRAATSLGMHYAIIQRRDRVQEAVDTGFILLLGAAALSYLVLAVVAPFTKVYALDPALLWALGLLFFLRPAATVTEGAFYRGFHFRRLFVVETASAVMGTGLAIGLAWAIPHGQRHWALAIAGLAREGLRALLGWAISPLRPRLRFDRTVARELLHFNKYLWAATVVMVLYETVGRQTLVELLSVGALGLYHFASTWVSRLGEISETIFGSVAISVYAKVQDDVPRLRESYCRIVRLSALFSTALLAGLVLVASEAVPLAFPLRWLPSVPIFHVLGLFYIVRAIDTTTGQLYVAVGKPRYNLWLGVVNLGVVMATVVPFVVWRGAVGAAFSLLLARLVTLGCNALVLRRVLQCSLADLAGVVMPALKAALVMATVVSAGLLGAHRAWGLVGWAPLLAVAGLGALSYGATIFLWERALFREMIGLLRDALRGRRARPDGLAP